MKTTIELPDTLLAQARRHADAHGLTLKSMIEQGLRSIMSEKQDKPPFRLRDGSFNGGDGAGGNGLTPEFQNAAWEQIRNATYEGRGA